MPPRKSTSSVTPADPDDSLLQHSSPVAHTDKPVFATEQQLKARAEAGASVEDYLLPRSLTIRLAKSVLPPNTTIQKDAVLAMQKAATVFVSYLSSHANDATLKRTIAPSDVFNALSELELDSFRGRLEQELEAYMEIKAGKRKPKKADENGSTEDALGEGATQADADVDMLDNPAKRVKRGVSVEKAVGPTAGDDGDETQEEDVEEEEEEEDETEEEEEEEDRTPREDNLEHVEDLDREPGARRGPYDPDAEETDEDEDGPGSQLRDDLGLG
ncbi:transcriptional regulator family: Histone-like TF [Penicillium roqueforti]|uniref:DNA polymerase epsilon subunit D n=1 Tax=Penicillium roqueforti (strain FM164) TaxID=1365484 RepID=W6Q1H6_PENRF|nr:transcriptional regulator family: Histone-like TF [Penicillium roqueforti]CDM30393.1 Histone-fold [Penicillium roqueforti FM164]KAF9240774.1 transcriptional regulator family: Histone-like TF [Penicillium roqueforti]KAI1838299.1 transcriptional regulator family: Histone-like TF [Penicillium roqueforti]KAI2680872.1 transcriptional regulator family: Histone-like TF [Penicillium roqueforti]KAI2691655.1 transcriptional regulator family: Histone-like TF [Penicillium roqueforti]